MAKFRDIKTLQKFSSVHASIHNHFNLDRHLNSRDIFKQNARPGGTVARLVAADRVRDDAPIAGSEAEPEEPAPTFCSNKAR